MFDPDARAIYDMQLKTLHQQSLFKHEPIITGMQGAWVTLDDGRRYLNLCSNNYLGFSGDTDVIQAASHALKTWGYGMASVRFICGTQSIHTQLESEVSDFLHCEDSILYSSCYDANAGLFEALLTDKDAIFSDALNHACIIDGIRLCNAQRYRYDHLDLSMLDSQLKQSTARLKLIVTDGVFSMDGHQADLRALIALADRYKALLMIDDSHGIGVLGTHGKGCSEHQDVLGKIDIISGTFGKALGGAAGGFIASHRLIIDCLRQRSRPYLFSNSLAPALVETVRHTLRMIRSSSERIQQLHRNIDQFKRGLLALHYDIDPTCHAIIPLYCGSAKKAVHLAGCLRESGILAIAFSYPVVPKDAARVRLQLSAALSPDDICFALDVFSSISS